jgi:hypothetical protein
MNKSNNTQKTLIEKQGFDDKDFKTSKHDQILKWCLKEENKLKILQLINKQFLNNFKDDWEKNHEYLESNIKKIEIEKVIQTNSNFIVGFFDLFFKINIKYKCDYWHTEDYDRRTKQFVNKYWDIQTVNKEFVIYFEIKTKCDNLGEILREVNYYKQFTYNSQQKDYIYYIVVAPECNFIEHLESQGVLFVKYDE